MANQRRAKQHTAVGRCLQLADSPKTRSARKKYTNRMEPGMPGFIIARVKISDMEKYREYMKATPASVEKYGGKIIVRGGENITLEGPTIDERVVVIEFESLEKPKPGIIQMNIKKLKLFVMELQSLHFMQLQGIKLGDGLKNNIHTRTFHGCYQPKR